MFFHRKPLRNKKKPKKQAEYRQEEEFYESEEYDSDSEYYESEEYEDENEAYYESEAYEEDGYYESEEYEEDGYYEPEAYEEEEYYESEEYEEDGEDYGPETYEEDEAYDEPEEYAKPSKAQKAQRKRKEPKLTVWTGFAKKLSGLSVMDKVLLATGAAVFIIAIVTGSLYIRGKALDAQVASFAKAGERLGSIGIVGESGLLALANAQAALPAAPPEMPDPEETKPPAKESFSIGINMTSVEKDLKLKFVDTGTGKLIKGIPFKVEVSDSAGKGSKWDDDDKDGIIYRKDMAPGRYQVALLQIDELAGYDFTGKTLSVTVKDKIEYKQIDVADEIKSEAEVNAAAEDTAQEVVTEEILADTVEWVASSKTEIGTGNGTSYEEVPKKNIPEPTAGARLFAFRPLSATDPNAPGGENQPENPPKEKPDPVITSVAISGGSEVNVGETITLTADVSGEGEYEKTVTWSSDSADASVDQNGVVTGVKAGTASIKAQSADERIFASVAITVKEKEKPPVITKIEIKGAKNIAVGESITLTAEVTGEGNYAKEVTWSSSDSLTASVDQNGVMAGIKAGTAKITAASADGTVFASVDITVTAQDGPPVARTLKISGTASVEIGKKTTLLAHTDEAGSPKIDVTWSSADKLIATVNEKGEVTGIKEGKVKITAVAKADANLTASLEITVTKRDPKLDTTTLLKDKDGNVVYVKDAKGGYVKAVYADYFTAKAFYKQAKTVTYRYTGWQTLNGKTYFFDKNGEPVKGGQIILGAKYVFASDGALVTGSGTMGIDVSKWNGSINWNAVRDSGVSYVIIRCGYRGSSTGALIEDPMFKKNIQGASAAGLKVGIYFFTQAVSEVEAVEEASMTINLIKKYGIAYPVFIDVEGSGGRADSLGKDARTAIVNAYCQTIQSAGYKAGIYANKAWLESKLHMGTLNRYAVWLAQYCAQHTYRGKVDLWQYSSSGKIGGITGKVDMNISYLGY